MHGLALWVLALVLGLRTHAIRPRSLLQHAPITLSSPSSRSLYNDSSGDDPAQRAALMAIYNATSGSQWAWAQTAAGSAGGQLGLWGTNGTSYCTWFGVTCCASSSLSMVDCMGPRSVVVLSMDSFGMQGTLPSDVGQLPQLTVLGMALNPGLTGTLPASIAQLSQLLWLSLTGTGVHACTGAGTAPALPAPACQLPPFLQFSANRTAPSSSPLLCPSVMLTSFLTYTASLPASLLPYVTSPYPQGEPPGSVVAAPSFFLYFACTCVDGLSLSFPDNTATCSSSPAPSSDSNSKYITAIVLVAVLPISVIALGTIIFMRYKAKIHQLVKMREEKMEQKRRRIPGMPGVALVNGRGTVPDTDLLVTWVFTDVEGSAKLWEDYPDEMSRAIDLHNTAIREVLDEFAGHEIRNEGDSFALAFHDAIDAVQFCLKTQETLQKLPWPARLLDDELCREMTAGDLWQSPATAGKGAKVISGLRVRMGINTGHAESMVMQDMTEEVGYRGVDYDLACEISDMAAGGQILMGPKTYQRWNKMCMTDVPPEAPLNLAPDLSMMSFAGGASHNGLGRDSVAQMSTMESREHNHSMVGMAPSGIWQRRYPSIIHVPTNLRASSEVHQYGALNGSLRMEYNSDAENALHPSMQHASRQATNSFGPAGPPGSFGAAGFPGSLTNLGSAALQQRMAVIGGERMGRSGSPQQRTASPQSQASQLDATASIPEAQSMRLDAQGRHIEPGADGQQQGQEVGPLRFRRSTEQDLGQLRSRVSGEADTAGWLGPPSGPAALPLRANGVGGPGKSRMLPSGGEPHRSLTDDSQRRVGGSSGGGSAPSAAAEAGSSVADFSAPSGRSYSRGMLPVGGSLQMQPVPGAVGRVGLGLAQVPTARGVRDSERESGTSGLMALEPAGQDGTGPDGASVDGGGGTTATAQRHHSLYSLGHRLVSHVTHRAASSLALAATVARRNASTTGARVGDVAGGVGDGDAAGAPARGGGHRGSSGGAAASVARCLDRMCGSLAFRCLGCIRLASSTAEGGLPASPTGRASSRAHSLRERLAAGSKADASAKCVLIDMGCYEWRRGAAAAAAADAGQAADAAEPEPCRVVHLMQVLAASVAPRALIFGGEVSVQSTTWEKISPGFFDAPGSERLSFPAMREIPGALVMSAAARPVVCVAFSSIEGFKEISALSLTLARQMLYLHNACVRETLSACGGYECKENDGGFMVAFRQCAAGMEWALTLQLALLEVPWAPELLSMDAASLVLEPCSTAPPKAAGGIGANGVAANGGGGGRVLLRGLRCRVGMFQGAVDRVTPNVKTGRADYFGQPCNRAARLMSAAYGGQVVCEQAIMEQVVAEWRQRYSGVAAGAGGGAGAGGDGGGAGAAALPTAAAGRMGPMSPSSAGGGLLGLDVSGSTPPLAHDTSVLARSFLSGSFTGRPGPSPRLSTPTGLLIPSPRNLPTCNLGGGTGSVTATPVGAAPAPPWGCASPGGSIGSLASPHGTTLSHAAGVSLHDTAEAALLAGTPRGRASTGASASSLSRSVPNTLRLPGLPSVATDRASHAEGGADAPEAMEFLSLPPSPNLLRKATEFMHEDELSAAGFGRPGGGTSPKASTSPRSFGPSTSRGGPRGAQRLLAFNAASVDGGGGGAFAPQPAGGGSGRLLLSPKTAAWRGQDDAAWAAFAPGAGGGPDAAARALPPASPSPALLAGSGGGSRPASQHSTPSRGGDAAPVASVPPTPSGSRPTPSNAYLDLLAPLSSYNKVKLQPMSWDPRQVGHRKRGGSGAAGAGGSADASSSRRRNSQGSVTLSNLSTRSARSAGRGEVVGRVGSSQDARSAAAAARSDSSRMGRMMGAHGHGVHSPASSSPLAGGDGGGSATHSSTFGQAHQPASPAASDPGALLQPMSAGRSGGGASASAGGAPPHLLRHDYSLSFPQYYLDTNHSGEPPPHGTQQQQQQQQRPRTAPAPPHAPLLGASPSSSPFARASPNAPAFADAPFSGDPAALSPRPSPSHAGVGPSRTSPPYNPRSLPSPRADTFSPPTAASDTSAEVPRTSAVTLNPSQPGATSQPHSSSTNTAQPRSNASGGFVRSGSTLVDPALSSSSNAANAGVLLTPGGLVSLLSQSGSLEGQRAMQSLMMQAQVSASAARLPGGPPSPSTSAPMPDVMIRSRSIPRSSAPAVPAARVFGFGHNSNDASSTSHHRHGSGGIITSPDSSAGGHSSSHGGGGRSGGGRSSATALMQRAGSAMPSTITDANALSPVYSQVRGPGSSTSASGTGALGRPPLGWSGRPPRSSPTSAGGQPPQNQHQQQRGSPSSPGQTRTSPTSPPVGAARLPATAPAGVGLQPFAPDSAPAAPLRASASAAPAVTLPHVSSDWTDAAAAAAVAASPLTSPVRPALSLWPSNGAVDVTPIQLSVPRVSVNGATSRGGAASASFPDLQPPSSASAGGDAPASAPVLLSLAQQQQPAAGQLPDSPSSSMVSLPALPSAALVELTAMNRSRPPSASRLNLTSGGGVGASGSPSSALPPEPSPRAASPLSRSFTGAAAASSGSAGPAGPWAGYRFDPEIVAIGATAATAGGSNAQFTGTGSGGAGEARSSRSGSPRAVEQGVRPTPPLSSGRSWRGPSGAGGTSASAAILHGGSGPQQQLMASATCPTAIGTLGAAGTPCVSPSSVDEEERKSALTMAKSTSSQQQRRRQQLQQQRGDSMREGGAGGAPLPSPRGGMVRSPDNKEGEERVSSTPRTVMAEVFKITPAAANGEDAVGGPSYTMFSYNINDIDKDQAEDGPAEVATLTTHTALIPTVPVDVCVWSLGSYRLKGMAELMKVVQVLPVQLEGRLQLFQKGALNKVKARPISREVAKLHQLTIRLPSVSHLFCCLPFANEVDAGYGPSVMGGPAGLRAASGQQGGPTWFTNASFPGPYSSTAPMAPVLGAIRADEMGDLEAGLRMGSGHGQALATTAFLAAASAGQERPMSWTGPGGGGVAGGGGVGASASEPAAAGGQMLGLSQASLLARGGGGEQHMGGSGGDVRGSMLLARRDSSLSGLGLARISEGAQTEHSNGGRSSVSVGDVLMVHGSGRGGGGGGGSSGLTGRGVGASVTSAGDLAQHSSLSESSLMHRARPPKLRIPDPPHMTLPQLPLFLQQQQQQQQQQQGAGQQRRGSSLGPGSSSGPSSAASALQSSGGGHAVLHRPSATAEQMGSTSRAGSTADQLHTSGSSSNAGITISGAGLASVVLHHPPHMAPLESVGEDVDPQTSQQQHHQRSLQQQQQQQQADQHRPRQLSVPSTPGPASLASAGLTPGVGQPITSRKRNSTASLSLNHFVRISLNERGSDAAHTSASGHLRGVGGDSDLILNMASPHGSAAWRELTVAASLPQLEGQHLSASMAGAGELPLPPLSGGGSMGSGPRRGTGGCVLQALHEEEMLDGTQAAAMLPPPPVIAASPWAGQQVARVDARQSVCSASHAANALESGAGMSMGSHGSLQDLSTFPTFRHMATGGTSEEPMYESSEANVWPQSLVGRESGAGTSGVAAGTSALLARRAGTGAAAAAPAAPPLPSVPPGDSNSNNISFDLPAHDSERATVTMVARPR